MEKNMDEGILRLFYSHRESLEDACGMPMI